MWAHIRAAHSIKRLYDDDKPKFENIPFSIKRSQRSMDIDALVEARVAAVLASRENVSNSTPRNIRAVPGTNDVRVTIRPGSDLRADHPIGLHPRDTYNPRGDSC